jgi:hypothetical protein
MTYNDLIKEFKTDILEMDIKDEEFITKFEVSKKFEPRDLEEVTVKITYKKNHAPDYGRRLFKKPKIRPNRRGGGEIIFANDSTDSLTFDVNTAADASGAMTFTSGSESTLTLG